MKKYLSFIFVFSLVFVFGMSVFFMPKTGEACSFGEAYDVTTGTPCATVIASMNTNGTVLGATDTRPNPWSALTRSLKRGTESSLVGFAQGALIASGLLSPESQTEYFGNKTTEAIKRFQKKAGLPADGIVGPKTWKAIQSVANSLPNPYVLYKQLFGNSTNTTRDDLVGQVPNECPKGTTGAYPDCLTEDAPENVCPTGTVGTYPNCVPYVSDTVAAVASSTGVCIGTSYPNIGATISVTFSGSVTVTGTPVIQILPSGPTLPYVSGSGTNTLTFTLAAPGAGSQNQYPSSAYAGSTFGFKPLLGGASIKVTGTNTNANLSGSWNLPAPLVKCITPATAPVCPTGTTGTYPNCTTPPTCPSGTTGTYPNCTTTPVVTTGCPYIGNVGGGTPPGCSVTTTDALVSSVTGSCTVGGMTLNAKFNKSVTVVGTPSLAVIAGGALFGYVSGSGTDTLNFTLSTTTYTPQEYFGTGTVGFVLDGGESIKTTGTNTNANLSGSWTIPSAVKTCINSLVGTTNSNLPTVTELTYQPVASGVDYYITLNNNVRVTGNQIHLKIVSSAGTNIIPFVSLLNGYILKFHSDTASSAPAFAGQATIQVSAGSSIQSTSGVVYNSTIPAGWLYSHQ